MVEIIYVSDIERNASSFTFFSVRLLKYIGGVWANRPKLNEFSDDFQSKIADKIDLNGLIEMAAVANYH